MKSKKRKVRRVSTAHTVKRKGHMEKFDTRKIYKTCSQACLGSHLTRKDTKKICDSVTASAKRWIRKRDIVTSDQIFRFVIRELKKHDKDVAFMYETHRDIS